ncbi:MAG: hypothetical protein MJ158_00845 [Alphaproteobacteria bacterium]|nr:hypothetical protein [Alphaproteobacteria bacterium]
MKKLVSILCIFTVFAPVCGFGAVTVKKAAPVATKQVEKMESVSSLMPTVMGLVGGVKALMEQQQQMTEDCAPTSEELKAVNELIQEFAKTGEYSAAELASSLGKPCWTEVDSTSSTTCYKSKVEEWGEEFTEEGPWYDVFGEKSDKQKIWYKFPKVSSAKYCKDGGNKNCVYLSNVYDVFNKISFTDADYTKTELSKVNKIREKAQKCAPAKLKAAKREAVGNFITQTVGSIGNSAGVGTGSMLETISSVAGGIGGGGGIKNMLPSLGGGLLNSLGQ